MAATNNFFACTETPLKLIHTDTDPILNRIKDNYACSKCKVRITSLVAGTGYVWNVPQGLAFDSPQTTLEFDGMRHSIQECVLTFPAMHVLSIPGMAHNDISGAELQVKFRGETSATTNTYYTLVLPIQIGEGMGAEFFASLGIIQQSRGTLGQVLQEDTPLLMYKGVDIAGRTSSPNNSNTCTNDAQKVFYLVALKPLNMRPADFNRLKTTAGITTGVGNAAVAGAHVTSDKEKLISYIPNIIVKNSVKRTSYVETSQVKCRPLDVSRDIKRHKSGKDVVYVGGGDPGQDRSLQEELDTAANVAADLGDIQPPNVSGVESGFAIALGVVLGIVVVSFIIWYVFKWTTRGYPHRQLLTYTLKKVPQMTAANAASIGGIATSIAAKAAAT
jgi:hypothetical protein